MHSRVNLNPGVDTASHVPSKRNGIASWYSSCAGTSLPPGLRARAGAEVGVRSGSGEIRRAWWSVNDLPRRPTSTTGARALSHAESPGAAFRFHFGPPTLHHPPPNTRLTTTLHPPRHPTYHDPLHLAAPQASATVYVAVWASCVSKEQGLSTWMLKWLHTSSISFFELKHKQ